MSRIPITQNNCHGEHFEGTYTTGTIPIEVAYLIGFVEKYHPNSHRIWKSDSEGTTSYYVRYWIL